jgi:hypothetical protein
MPNNAFGYYHAGLTPAQRDSLLHTLLAGSGYIIHQTDGRIRFEAWPQTAINPAGKAFNSQLEVRWWPRDDACELLVISDAAQSACTGTEWTELDDLIGDEPKQKDKIYLWGSHWHSLIGKDKAEKAGLDYWVQAGIQAKLHYPLPPQAERGAVRVQTRTYRRGGIPQLTRFVGIEAADDPGRVGDKMAAMNEYGEGADETSALPEGGE